MFSKYQKAISEIKVSNELKEKIKMSIEQECLENRKEGIFMKLKKKMSAIIAIVTALLCSGFVFAAIVNKIPQNEEFGIKFSDNYPEYEEILENGPSIEKDGTVVTLKSKVADEGFIVLKFNVTLSEKQSLDEKQLFILSFNDNVINIGGVESLPLGGGNYNIIIDGNNYFIRPGADQRIVEIVKNKEYEVYQMWFLTNELKDKKDFTITLDKVVAEIDKDFIKFDDKFEIELSKEKSRKNTSEIHKNNVRIEYKKMTQTLDSIKVTPLQTIVELTEILGETNGLFDINDKDNIGDIQFKAYDQNNVELTTYNCPRESKIKYKDGTLEDMSGPNELPWIGPFEYEQYITKRYLAIEGNKDITQIRIEVLDYYDYDIRYDEYKRTTNIGTYYVDLTKKDIKANNKNELIYSEKVYEDEQDKDNEINNNSDGLVSILTEQQVNEKRKMLDSIEYIDMTEENYKKYNNENGKYIFKLLDMTSNGNGTVTIKGRVYKNIDLPILTKEQYNDLLNGKNVNLMGHEMKKNLDEELEGHDLLIEMANEGDPFFKFYVDRNNDGTGKLYDYCEIGIYEGTNIYMKLQVDENIETESGLGKFQLKYYLQNWGGMYLYDEYEEFNPLYNDEFIFEDGVCKKIIFNSI